MSGPLEAETLERERREKERERILAYRTANRLVTSAGLALVLAGVQPRAPELEALRQALRAINLAGGIEAPRKEETHVFPSGAGRCPRSAG